VGTGRGTCRPAIIAESRGVCSSGIAGAVEGWGRLAHTGRGLFSSRACGTGVPHSGQVPLVLPVRNYEAEPSSGR
jgi:hypothetical protein